MISARGGAQPRVNVGQCYPHRLLVWPTLSLQRPQWMFSARGAAQPRVNFGATVQAASALALGGLQVLEDDYRLVVALSHELTSGQISGHLCTRTWWPAGAGRYWLLVCLVPLCIFVSF